MRIRMPTITMIIITPVIGLLFPVYTTPCTYPIKGYHITYCVAWQHLYPGNSYTCSMAVLLLHIQHNEKFTTAHNVVGRLKYQSPECVSGIIHFSVVKQTSYSHEQNCLAQEIMLYLIKYEGLSWYIVYCDNTHMFTHSQSRGCRYGRVVTTVQPMVVVVPTLSP